MKDRQTDKNLDKWGQKTTYGLMMDCKSPEKLHFWLKNKKGWPLVSFHM